MNTNPSQRDTPTREEQEDHGLPATALVQRGFDAVPSRSVAEIMAGFDWQGQASAAQRQGTGVLWTEPRFAAECAAGLKQVTDADEVPAGSTVFVYAQALVRRVEMARAVAARGARFIGPHTHPDKIRFAEESAEAYATLAEMAHMVPRLCSHWNFCIHETLCQALERTRDLDGCFVEVGVYRGGSALTALTYMRRAGIHRPTHLLDSFDGFEYPEACASADATWEHTHGGLNVHSIKRALETAAVPFSLHVRNIITDGLPPEITQIAVANVDVDLLEATASALETLAPLVVVGGIMVCEDPTSAHVLGAAVAMQAFLRAHRGEWVPILMSNATYMLLRIQASLPVTGHAVEPASATPMAAVVEPRTMPMPSAAVVEPPTISIVATARNDNYGGRFAERVEGFIASIAAQALHHHVRTEVVLVEWNPVVGKPGMADLLRTGRCAGIMARAMAAGVLTVRVPVVSTELHMRFPNRAGRPLPMFEVLGKNVGIRRATGRLVLVANPDLIFTSAFFASLKAGFFSTETYLYRCCRIDVRPLPETVDLADTSATMQHCRDKAFVLHGYGGPVDVSGTDVDALMVAGAQNAAQRVMVPYPFGNACGDFMLAGRQHWLDIMGCPEITSQFTALDGLTFQYLCAKLEVWVLPLHMAVFHQDHARPHLAEGEVQPSASTTPSPNVETEWGLAHEVLPETVFSCLAK
jgi:hypothetical protein